MPLKVLDATLSTFNSVFEKFKNEAGNNKSNLILFLADNEPSTNRSWCPGHGVGSKDSEAKSLGFSKFDDEDEDDCVRAEPAIYKKLESSGDDVALLRAYVGDRPTWRNPRHPWRVDSNFKLKGVPTLLLWENGKVKGRLEDHEAHIERKIDALVASE